MNWVIFDSFCEMLTRIPIRAVIRVADLERKMIEDDLRKKRTELDDYVASVLVFCNFLLSAVRGTYASVSTLPFEHRAFYASIVRKLVDAGELPSEFKSYFEGPISSNFGGRIPPVQVVLQG